MVRRRTSRVAGGGGASVGTDSGGDKPPKKGLKERVKAALNCVCVRDVCDKTADALRERGNSVPGQSGRWNNRFKAKRRALVNPRATDLLGTDDEFMRSFCPPEDAPHLLPQGATYTDLPPQKPRVDTDRLTEYVTEAGGSSRVMGVPSPGPPGRDYFAIGEEEEEDGIIHGVHDCPEISEPMYFSEMKGKMKSHDHAGIGKGNNARLVDDGSSVGLGRARSLSEPSSLSLDSSLTSTGRSTVSLSNSQGSSGTTSTGVHRSSNDTSKHAVAGSEWDNLNECDSRSEGYYSCDDLNNMIADMADMSELADSQPRSLSRHSSVASVFSTMTQAEVDVMGSALVMAQKRARDSEQKNAKLLSRLTDALTTIKEMEEQFTAHDGSTSTVWTVPPPELVDAESQTNITIKAEHLISWLPKELADRIDELDNYTIRREAFKVFDDWL